MRDEACIASIIEANPDELAVMELEHVRGPVHTYLRVRKAYLKGDYHELSRIIAHQKSLVERDEEHEVVLLLAQLRSIVRLGKRNDGLADSVVSKSKQLQLAWQAETAIVVALMYDAAGDHRLAKQGWEEAFRLCKKAGLSRKGATCYHNAVAALSRIAPDRRLYCEYWQAYRLAKESGEMLAAGMALTNLAREYQLDGSYRMAWRHIEDAVMLLKSHAFRTFSYFLALANRSHIAMDLGRDHLALEGLDELESSPFPEARDALATLKNFKLRPQETNQSLDKANISVATWSERKAKQQSSALKLSKLEEKLVVSLSTGAKTKFELVVDLYGEQQDFFTSENRLKQLLHRFRQKRPGLVAADDGFYFLSQGGVLYNPARNDVPLAGR